METTTATRLPVILADYHTLYPDVELSLTTGPTDKLLDTVLNYEVEAAFVAAPVDHPLLQQAAVIQEELVLVSSSSSKNPILTSGLTVLAFREGCSYRKRLEQYLDHVGVQSRKVIELGILDGILGCVAAGLGVAMVPKTAVDEGRYNLTLHEIPDEFGNVPTVLVLQKDGFVSSALAKFVDAVQESQHSFELDLSSPTL